MLARIFVRWCLCCMRLLVSYQIWFNLNVLVYKLKLFLLWTPVQVCPQMNVCNVCVLPAAGWRCCPSQRDGTSCFSASLFGLLTWERRRTSNPIRSCSSRSSFTLCPARPWRSSSARSNQWMLRPTGTPRFPTHLKYTNMIVSITLLDKLNQALFLLHLETTDFQYIQFYFSCENGPQYYNWHWYCLNWLNLQYKICRY